MGEQADMMIGGFLCVLCGVFLDGEEPGFPRQCQSCADDGGEDWPIAKELD